MAESTPSNPNHMVLPSTPGELPSPLLQAQPSSPSIISFPRPSFRITNEYDSKGSIFMNRVSCKIFDGLAKLRLAFQNNRRGEVVAPQIGFISKYLTALYDVEEQNAVVRSSVDLGSKVHLQADHYVKNGEVKRPLSIDGIVKNPLLNGLCTVMFENENLKVRYLYKDEEISVSSSILLPFNAQSFAFKRRFRPSDKLSYFYTLDSNQWGAVYKHSGGADYTLISGYDSEAKLGWASIWLGDESFKAKCAPMKMKVQFMIQVPQDNIRSPLFMFRVKKRWDV
ncbi:hypothetical protein QQ045_030599 [Rhodiola kirilowii]